MSAARAPTAAFAASLPPHGHPPHHRPTLPAPDSTASTSYRPTSGGALAQAGASFHHAPAINPAHAQRQSVSVSPHLSIGDDEGEGGDSGGHSAASESSSTFGFRVGHFNSGPQRHSAVAGYSRSMTSTVDEDEAAEQAQDDDDAGHRGVAADGDDLGDKQSADPPRARLNPADDAPDRDDVSTEPEDGPRQDIGIEPYVNVSITDRRRFPAADDDDYVDVAADVDDESSFDDAESGDDHDHDVDYQGGRGSVAAGENRGIASTSNAKEGDEDGAGAGRRTSSDRFQTIEEAACGTGGDDGSHWHDADESPPQASSQSRQRVDSAGRRISVVWPLPAYQAASSTAPTSAAAQAAAPEGRADAAPGLSSSSGRPIPLVPRPSWPLVTARRPANQRPVDPAQHQYSGNPLGRLNLHPRPHQPIDVHRLRRVRLRYGSELWDYRMDTSTGDTVAYLTLMAERQARLGAASGEEMHHHYHDARKSRPGIVVGGQRHGTPLQPLHQHQALSSASASSAAAATAFAVPTGASAPMHGDATATALDPAMMLADAVDMLNAADTSGARHHHHHHNVGDARTRQKQLQQVHGGADVAIAAGLEESGDGGAGADDDGGSRGNIPVVRIADRSDDQPSPGEVSACLAVLRHHRLSSFVRNLFAMVSDPSSAPHVQWRDDGRAVILRGGPGLDEVLARHFGNRSSSGRDRSSSNYRHATGRFSGSKRALGSSPSHASAASTLAPAGAEHSLTSAGNCAGAGVEVAVVDRESGSRPKQATFMRQLNFYGFSGRFGLKAVAALKGLSHPYDAWMQGGDGIDPDGGDESVMNGEEASNDGYRCRGVASAGSAGRLESATSPDQPAPAPGVEHLSVWQHKHFQRGRQDLLPLIVRKTNPRGQAFAKIIENGIVSNGGGGVAGDDADEGDASLRERLAKRSRAPDAPSASSTSASTPAVAAVGVPRVQASVAPPRYPLRDRIRATATSNGNHRSLAASGTTAGTTSILATARSHGGSLVAGARSGQLTDTGVSATALATTALRNHQLQFQFRPHHCGGADGGAASAFFDSSDLVLKPSRPDEVRVFANLAPAAGVSVCGAGSAAVSAGLVRHQGSATLEDRSSDGPHASRALSGTIPADADKDVSDASPSTSTTAAPARHPRRTRSRAERANADATGTAGGTQLPVRLFLSKLHGLLSEEQQLPPAPVPSSHSKEDGEVDDNKGSACSCNGRYIAWNEAGTAFCILDPEGFARHVLPLYYSHSNLHSFARQLNYYNFLAESAPPPPPVQPAANLRPQRIGGAYGDDTRIGEDVTTAAAADRMQDEDGDGTVANGHDDGADAATTKLGSSPGFSPATFDSLGRRLGARKPPSSHNHRSPGSHQLQVQQAPPTVIWYRHPHFQRDHPEWLCRVVRRTNRRGRAAMLKAARAVKAAAACAGPADAAPAGCSGCDGDGDAEVETKMDLPPQLLQDMFPLSVEADNSAGDSDSGASGDGDGTAAAAADGAHHDDDEGDDDFFEMLERIAAEGGTGRAAADLSKNSGEPMPDRP